MLLEVEKITKSFGNHQVLDGVSFTADGTRHYSPRTLVGPELSGTAGWTVPEGTSTLWMVVSATPSAYMTHLWDENDDNDAQWPYRFSIAGAVPK